jgi:hypothetical protein
MDSGKYGRMQRILRETAEKHRTVVHLNYGSDKRFSDDDFYDGDHLNVKGAQKFSDLLHGDLAVSPNSPTDLRFTTAKR